jgi:hypothetical protein
MATTLVPMKLERAEVVRRNWCVLLASLVAGGRAAWGFSPFGPHDVTSIFFVGKSQNKNQVHYGVNLDETCLPRGREPVYAYWRMMEGAGEIEPLLDHEQPAYGILPNQDPSRGLASGNVGIVLRAFPHRPITITTERAGDHCRAIATVDIDGSKAQLVNIYVRLKWPFGIDYVLLSGRRVEDGRWVREKISE